MSDFRWFSKWSSDNPRNIFGPGIFAGVVGGAILVVTMVIVWGYPARVTAIQTGPRGTGMEVVKFADAAAEPDPTIAAYYTEAPIPPAGGETLARDLYENVQVLGDLTEDNFNRLMLSITEWVSPEQGCAYCHGEDGEFASDDVYTKVVARRMLQMTQNINENYEFHVAPAGVNCYTCHRGQNVPSNIWFNSTPVNDVMAGWGAVQNQATPISQYTSLPSDALEKFLLEANPIGVHDLEPRVANAPGDPTWQDAERTFSLMNYFSNALNVNCVFCHNTRAFNDTEQVTPQWSLAQYGIGMVQELNNEYLVPLKDTYPANRLGPLHADAPKAACATCHKEYSKPLQGLNVIGDWPELAKSGPPVYQ